MLKLSSSRFAVLFATVLFSVLVLSACGDKSASLVGKWEQVSTASVSGFGAKPGTVIEFYGDGNLNLGSYAGVYQLIDGSTVKIGIGNGAIASMYTYTLSGDKLTFQRTGSTDPTSQYKRKA